MRQPLTLTLAILKPHVVANPVALADIRHTILGSQFKIVRSKQKKLTHEEACTFYDEHREKFFFGRLVTFMTSGPLEVYIMAHNDAIRNWRLLMGPTKVFKAQFSHPESIRGKYGLSDTRNATHGSDSMESAKKEIDFFFPDFNMKDWYTHEEAAFREGGSRLAFNEEKFIHEVQTTC